MENISVFSMNGKMACTQLAEHTIELEESAKQVVEPLRRRPQVHVQEVRKQIKMMLEDIIEESESPWASAYV